MANDTLRAALARVYAAAGDADAAAAVVAEMTHTSATAAMSMATAHARSGDVAAALDVVFTHPSFARIGAAPVSAYKWLPTEDSAFTNVVK
jgi:hypothetical protein